MSVRARRIVSGRSDTVAANYAFDPLNDDKIIRNRLLTRTTTTRGEPPLKKLQKKFTSFVIELDKEEDNYSDCGRLAKAFLQELSAFEIPLLKSHAVDELQETMEDEQKNMVEEMQRNITADGAEAMSID